MKQIEVTLFDDVGEPLPRTTFPSAREAREAESRNKRRLLDLLGWGRQDDSRTLAEIAWFVRMLQAGGRPVATTHADRARIRDGWFDAGKSGAVLGDPIVVGGVSWTPILWDDEEDPTFHKTVGLEDSQ